MELFETENSCEKKASTLCGYDTYDIHRAKPAKVVFNLAYSS